MLSERSLAEWDTLAQAGATDAVPFSENDRFHRFLIGLHLRGEELTAHELKDLLDQTDLGEDERQELWSFVESAFALLTAYDAVLEEDRRSYEEDQVADGFEI